MNACRYASAFMLGMAACVPTPRQVANLHVVGEMHSVVFLSRNPEETLGLEIDLGGGAMLSDAPVPLKERSPSLVLRRGRYVFQDWRSGCDEGLSLDVRHDGEWRATSGAVLAEFPNGADAPFTVTIEDVEFREVGEGGVIDPDGGVITVDRARWTDIPRFELSEDDCWPFADL